MRAVKFQGLVVKKKRTSFGKEVFGVFPTNPAPAPIFLSSLCVSFSRLQCDLSAKDHDQVR